MGENHHERAGVSEPPDIRVPRATYRLQLNKAFPLPAAQDAVPYLKELGVSDVYASPVLQARPGSAHGYDVVDHSRINEELGGDEAFEAFGKATKAAGLGILLDVVPNHMCVEGNFNGWWMDVLEHGPSSPFATHFDIDWRPPKLDLADRVLLPVLGDQYGRVLENDLTIQLVDGSFRVALPYAWFPLAPRSWIHILNIALEQIRQTVEPNAHPLLELESIITALSHLPRRNETDPERVRERRRETQIVVERLVQLHKDGNAKTAIDGALRVVNGRRGDQQSFDHLERLLSEQAYRLSFWRVAADEINYRRFFDINELAAIRVELPEVFEAVHNLTLRLAAAGYITGLRIDHVDGLYDPQKYLTDLQSAWKASTGHPAYVVVEKILGPGEVLPDTWAVSGTTGYDYLNLALSTCVDTGSARALELVASGIAEGPARYAEVMLQSKRLVLESSMSSELTVLARRLDRISEQHRYTRDFTLNNLQSALAQVIAGFAVYRSYVRPLDQQPTERDQEAINKAINYARRHNPATSRAVFDFIRDVLLLNDPDGLSPAQIAERREFVLKLQQVTGPIMAKGLEDTAFYRYYPLAALNEVGGEPHHFGMSLQAFHSAQKRRLENMPHTMLATATHDTKRGEDTRARLIVLSEIPNSWRRALERWFALNERLATDLPLGRAPSRYEEFFIYQTLIGTWPIGGFKAGSNYLERLLAYVEKALKEAKQNTSWISPNEPHDQAVKQFLTQILDPSVSAEFLADIERFQRKTQWAGYWNGLAQVILKMASPGVPDVYQGTELWDLSLVDPDNRRPVDYGFRRSALEKMKREFTTDADALISRLVQRPHDGCVKLWTLHRALLCRSNMAQVFADGNYAEITVEGACAEQVIAFARTHGNQVALSVTGRFFTRFLNQLRHPLGEVWADTVLRLPPELREKTFVDALTGRKLDVTAEGILPVSQIFATMPVALLTLGSDNQSEA